LTKVSAHDTHSASVTRRIRRNDRGKEEHMARIDKTRLSPRLQDKVALLMMAARLPNNLPWPKGVTTESIDPFIQIRKDGFHWTVSNGANEDGAYVDWRAEIETDTGIVRARPVLLASALSGPALSAEILGFESRVIGTLEKLKPFLPPNVLEKALIADLNLPLVYAEARVIDIVREDVSSRLRALCSFDKG
jgi:hypothetical protein